MKKIIFSVLLWTAGVVAAMGGGTGDTVRVYTFPIQQEIGPAMWRITQKGLAEAAEKQADLIIIHLNTYGGLVEAADSIRTRILNSPVPIYVFVDNNAISAGALISVAADKIYMRSGANIGASTVVNGVSGEQMPDKYQSFMRSLMRASAESHGRDTVVVAGDTLIRWVRDPRIAEAMVDPSVAVPGLTDTGKVLTMTALEAVDNRYCEGIVENIPEIIARNGISTYRMESMQITALDRMIDFLLNPALRGIFILCMLGGLYFELQSPGIGFPSAVAVAAAVFYFAPLYLEGLAAHWEIGLFILGMILLIVEIFVTPGFGVAGVAGIMAMVAGLTLGLIDNIVFSWDFGYAIVLLLKYLLFVLSSLLIGFAGILWLTPKAVAVPWLRAASLSAEQRRDEGYVGVDTFASMMGRTGLVSKPLRPSGKVMIDGIPYDAVSLYGYLDKGAQVRVAKTETGQLYVETIEL